MILLLFQGHLCAQSTSVQQIGTIQATAALAGLGWNVNQNNDAEFAAVAAAGGTWVRFQCSWISQEIQSAAPNNTSGGFSLSSDCAAGLASAKRYGLAVDVVAAYGPPFHQILTVTASSAVAAGSHTVPVSFVSGNGGTTLASLSSSGTDLLLGPGNNAVTPKPFRDYSGSLIVGYSATDATDGVITLAAGVCSVITTSNGCSIVGIAAGTTLTISRQLYVSPQTGSPSDASNIRFANYAQFLAQQIQAAGLVGNVEMWNEPPWGGSCWDNIVDCYDSDPGITGELKGNLANYGLFAVLQTYPAIPGVGYIWAGTNKSGSSDLLAGGPHQYSGVYLQQPTGTVGVESSHPYGINPEDNAWSHACLLGYISSPSSWSSCNLGNPSSNFNLLDGNTLVAQATNALYGISRIITETGTTCTTTSCSEINKTSFTMRQFFAFLAALFRHIDFYRLVDTTAGAATGYSFGSVSGSTFTPLQSYTSFAAMMSFLAPFSGNTSSVVGTVGSYAGPAPLDVVDVVGTRSGNLLNTDIKVVWVQTSCSSPSTCFVGLASPSAVSVPFTPGPGQYISAAVDLVTGSAVPYTASSAMVADHPVAVVMDPISHLRIRLGAHTIRGRLTSH